MDARAHAIQGGEHAAAPGAHIAGLSAYRLVEDALVATVRVQVDRREEARLRGMRVDPAKLHEARLGLRKVPAMEGRASARGWAPPMLAAAHFRSQGAAGTLVNARPHS